MAIVVDAARPAGPAVIPEGGQHNTTYQKGNDNTNTPNPAWLTFIAYNNSAAETHVTSRGDATPWAPINNTADAWAPIVAQTFLTSTPATVR